MWLNAAVTTFLWVWKIQQCIAYVPELNHRHLAGLWKLTKPKSKGSPGIAFYPLKEFTVYPKDKDKQSTRLKQQQELISDKNKDQQDEEEMLLMLKEDGSFQQYADDDVEEEVTIPDKLSFLDDSDAVLERFLGKIKGQWDFVDGKLILAADRPENSPSKEDTLLIGDVVATSGESLADNPVIKKRDNEILNATVTSQTKPAKDTHLSVPSGEVNVGRFFYPKSHPSFFEQPIFQPTPKGNFQMKQVLGSLNTQNPEEEEELIEKFRADDFYGKRFLLTSHPIGQHKPKGRQRWSIKYNKFVEDAPSKAAKKAAEDAEKRPANIRVMEVQFFSNNTFATVAGLGESILRGKFHIIGEKRDQLSMRISRFGFGRSVSGSVYSEGRSLTAEDQKLYWGKISYEDEAIMEGRGDTDEDAPTAEPPENDGERRLYVKGSVIFGAGLEPEPVGRFIMTETEAIDDEDYDDDEDEEDEEEFILKFPDTQDEDEIDWSTSFQ